MFQALTRAFGRAHDMPSLLLTLAALFWAGNTIAAQLAADQVTPFQLVLLRWVIVAALMWSLYGREALAYLATARQHFGRICVMAFTGFTGFNLLFYLASLHTTAVNVGILQGSIPVFVLIGLFLSDGSRVSMTQAVGVALTIAGVVLLSTGGNPLGAMAGGVATGDLMMLGACALYAFYAVLLKARPDIPGRAFFTLMTPIALVTALPPVLLEAAYTTTQWPTGKGWLVTLYVAIFPSCLAQLFFLRSVDLIGPGRAGVYANLVPVFGAGLAVALLGESFRWYHALALVLVLGGIALAQRTAIAAGKSRQ